MFLSRSAEERIAALLTDHIIKVHKATATTSISDDVALTLQTNILQLVDLCGPNVQNSFNKKLVKYLTTGAEK